MSVQAVEGKVQVQRSGKHSWEKVSVGRRIFDNDLLQTDFNSRLTLKSSDGAGAIIGSDSKTLISIVNKSPAAGGREVGYSLLSGGILLNATGHERLSVYTGNAVGEVDSGVLATYIETEGRQTGLFNLGGSVLIRGILQQKGRKLLPGRASFVIPGRDPVFHIPLSYRHVASLKRLFGDSYIDTQLQVSKIVPLEDKQVDNSLALSLQESEDSLAPGRLFYEPLFSLNKIYGSILDDRSATDRSYTPICRPTSLSDSVFSVALFADVGFGDNAFSGYNQIIPSLKSGIFEGALRLPDVDSQSSVYLKGLVTERGILNMVDHLTLGNAGDSMYVTAGALRDITLGQGLIVNHFRNFDNNRIFQPIGIAGEVKYSSIFDASGFIADVTDPALGGFYIKSSPSIYTFGVGCYFDANQYGHTSDTDDLRFTRQWPSSSATYYTGPGRAGVADYEVDLGATIASWYDFSSRVFVDYAQNRSGGGDDGDIYRMPDIELNWPGTSLSFGLMLETGTIISDEFDQSYYSRRAFFKGDTVFTENTVLDRNRFARTLFVNFAKNIARGVDLNAGYTLVFGSDNPYAGQFDTASPGNGRSVSSNDYSFNVRLSLNQEALPFITYASVYAFQNHAELFPASGGFMSSWNSEAGFEFMTQPIFSSVSLQGGARYFYVDKGPFPNENDVIDPGEGVWDLSLGLVWSIL